MAKFNRICKVCGNKYSYCPTCSGDVHKPKWMTMFDCEDCRTIFNTLTNMNLGKINKLEAKTILLKTNINKEFTDMIKRDIENIMAEEKVVIKEPEPIIELEESISLPAEESIKKSKKTKKYDSIEQEF